MMHLINPGLKHGKREGNASWHKERQKSKAELAVPMKRRYDCRIGHVSKRATSTLDLEKRQCEIRHANNVQGPVKIKGHNISWMRTTEGNVASKISGKTPGGERTTMLRRWCDALEGGNALEEEVTRWGQRGRTRKRVQVEKRECELTITRSLRNIITSIARSATAVSTGRRRFDRGVVARSVTIERRRSAGGGRHGVCGLVVMIVRGKQMDGKERE